MLQNLLQEEDRALGNECAKTIPNSCVSARPETDTHRQRSVGLLATAFWRMRSALVESPTRETSGRSPGGLDRPRRSLLLLAQGEVCTAILLPALLALLIAEGLLFSVADGFDAVASNSELYKLVANAIGTA